MRLSEVKLTNFRGYANETCIKVDSLTVLIGKNDSGKSSILDALDIYFNDANIEHDDCCVHTGGTEVRIGCVFDGLPASIIIDEQYSTTLQAEYLLRGDRKLEIVKVYDCNAVKGKFTGAFARALHPSATGIDELLSLKLPELKTKAQQRTVDLTGVNQTAKAPIRQAIWAAAGNLQLTEHQVSLKKESAKDAFDQIQRYMPTYALFKSDRASTDQDAEAQDPLKAAIKEAIRRRETELDGVLAEIRNELASVANRTVEKIREMSPDLANQLHPTVKNKNWDTLFNVALTGENDIPINKRGSGTRRLVLLNFFRAKAEDVAQERDTGVIYAVEEPETSQHPNYQLMLLDAFEQLVDQGRCQVILTTHTPTLARRVDQNSLRLITWQNNHPVVEDGAVAATIPKIVKTLGVLRDHDVKVFLGVEGKHDINFLKSISTILSRIETDIPDLAAAEASGRLVFIPLGGSSLEVWVNRLEGFNLPEFYLTDRDNPPPALPKYEQYLAAWNARAGCTAWVTTKRELENYIHLSLLVAAAPGYAGTGADFDDVPLLFAEAIHTADQNAQPWAVVSEDSKKKKESKAKSRLNSEIIQGMTPVLLTQADPTDEIRRWLRTVGATLNA
jgi:predicted ATPase